MCVQRERERERDVSIKRDLSTNLYHDSIGVELVAPRASRSCVASAPARVCGVRSYYIIVYVIILSI